MPFIQSVVVYEKYRRQTELRNLTVPVFKAEQCVDFILEHDCESQGKKDFGEPARIAEHKRAIVQRLHGLQNSV